MKNFRTRHGYVRVVTCAVALALFVVACGSEDIATNPSTDLEFSDMWTRQPATGQTAAAVYGTVANSGETDIRIVGVTSSAVTDVAELHETTMEDGVMSMNERTDGFVVPAGGTFTFEPGGPHIMLFAIDPETYPTDAVDVTFRFDKGDDAFATAVVRNIDGSDSMEMDHGEMDHDSMEADDS